MKQSNIGIFCQSDYLSNILAKYFFFGFMERVRQIIFWPPFIDHLAGQHVGAVCRRLWVYEHKILSLIFGVIFFQIIDFRVN